MEHCFNSQLSMSFQERKEKSVDPDNTPFICNILLYKMLQLSDITQEVKIKLNHMTLVFMAVLSNVLFTSKILPLDLYL